jgi:hypothetical protein
MNIRVGIIPPEGHLVPRPGSLYVSNGDAASQFNAQQCPLRGLTCAEFQFKAIRTTLRRLRMQSRRKYAENEKHRGQRRDALFPFRARGVHAFILAGAHQETA